ncbi:hypothetical protein GCM10009841_23070 [Microlunatus panaciterrae]|uniref:CDP-glycerol glycerophosphotransferase n=1 Tax=Microlunatus panaciterrae TaxID=400768 RepID=A0ABS2RDV9_9ACTN|nr:CDP-glycerol glycerophosphotransferase family protein [Microlunatus panaciterrae]MBM7797189.1 CDP-glycerol glycerophosphotransferase [Microlunatus panaciterrae]
MWSTRVRRALRHRLAAIRRRVASTATTKPRKVASRKPKLSVVVDAYDGFGPFFSDCLSQLLGHEPADREILVVLHGASSSVRSLALAQAQLDNRIVVLDDTFEDAATARNAGAARAQGTFIAFVRGCDVIPARGHLQLVRSLIRSGSDLAVGRLVVRRGPVSPSSIDFESEAGTGFRLADRPSVVSDTFVGNRVFRRKFWSSQRLSFEPKAEPDAMTPMIKAYLNGSFDLVADPVYTQQERAEGKPFGWIRPQFARLDDWLRDYHAAQQLLTGPNGTAAARAWRLALLDGGLLPFIDDAEVATAGQWSSLRTVVGELSGQVDASDWSRIRAESKIKLWLVRQDRRADLVEFLVSRWYVKPQVETTVSDGSVLARLPFFEQGRDDLPWQVGTEASDSQSLPMGCFEMAPSETPLVVSLRRASWRGPVLECEVWAFIRRVEAADLPTTLRVRLRSPAPHSPAAQSPGADDLVEVVAEPRCDPAINLWAADRFQDHRRHVFSFEIEADRLTARAGTWVVDFELTVAGLVRTGGLTRVDPQGSAAQLSACVHRGTRLWPKAERRSGFRIEVGSTPAQLVQVRVDGRTVVGAVTAGPATRLRRLVARNKPLEVDVLLSSTGTDRGFSLTLPEPPADSGGSWTVRAVTDEGAEVPVGWPEEVVTGQRKSGPDASVAAVRTAAGNLAVEEASACLLVDAVTVNETALTVEGRWLGRPPSTAVVELRSDDVSVTGTVQESDGGLRVTFGLRLDRWGRGEALLPGRRYALVARGGSSDVAVPAWAGEELLGELPVDHCSTTVRCQVVATRGRAVELVLSAPLDDHTLSPVGQLQLQRRYARALPAIDHRAVYLQSYDGRVATDTQLALHEELRRRGTDVKLYWGVADHATLLPEGAIPLVIKSPEWYDKLASVGYLVNNVDFDRWFAKKPGQRFLQTFHGYPSKAMGLTLWRAKNFSPRRIEAERNRTCETWDLAVTPTPEMSAHYRREYRYEGPLFEQGYPRNDILRSAHREHIRARTRRSLGIAPHQTVVLYAPTWRDDIATGYEAAPLPTHFDLDLATAELGSDFVLLLRGHRFHSRRAAASAAEARLVDVTDYPEVNDLILAADAGVFDYSSIRFDFALCGKPMIFLVPDLDSYAGGGRGFLFDYSDSAPGPKVATSAEVVSSLQNLAGVQDEYRLAYQEFNARFNAWNDGAAAARLVEAFFGPQSRAATEPGGSRSA